MIGLKSKKQVGYAGRMSEANSKWLKEKMDKYGYSERQRSQLIDDIFSVLRSNDRSFTALVDKSRCS